MNYMKTPRKKSKELEKNTSHIFLPHFFHKNDKESVLKGAHNLKYRCHIFILTYLHFINMTFFTY